MKILLTALAALVLAVPAFAAPPPNDNRADSRLLPTFPAAAHGTTAEATVERLDPQVSPCGRIDGTVWYRIEAAPDGTIVAAVQGAGPLAPIVRIYRRNPSNIQELACGTAKAGGKATASVQAVRGAGYLLLVGRRPGTADGEFDIRVDLYLPPPNDIRGDAQRLGRLPANVHGSTLGATGDDLRVCGLSGGGVWYRLNGPKSGRAIVQLAAGERDAAVAAFHAVRSRVEPVTCAATDRRGNAVLAFGTKPGGAYLLLVGDRRGSNPGDFRLSVRAGEMPERLPGRSLPRGGVHESVNGLTDANDVWSVRLHRGTTYRIAFSSSPCARASLRTRNTVVSLGCGRYMSFTPGRDGGGRYSFEVEASPTAGRQTYRLRVAAAGADDLGVGIGIAAGSTARGALAPSGIDVVDVYHFDVERLSEARLGLTQPAGRSFSVLLLDDSGRRISSDSGTLRRRLGRGRYVVAVGGTVGTRSGRYRLSLLLRDVTSTSVLISGQSSAEVSPGATVSLSCVVSPLPSGGRVELQIDRFDPLSGWHFHGVMRVAAGATVSWRPPAAGRWRVRARFLGTRGSAPSRSGYAHLLVARPIR
jgi:hypothetical protein